MFYIWCRWMQFVIKSTIEASAFGDLTPPWGLEHWFYALSSESIRPLAPPWGLEHWFYALSRESIRPLAPHGGLSTESKRWALSHFRPPSPSMGTWALIPGIEQWVHRCLSPSLGACVRGRAWTFWLGMGHTMPNPGRRLKNNRNCHSG